MKCLHGKVPFDADTPVSVALKHMQEEPVPPKNLNENMPKAVNDIILKAMRKDLNLRYQSSSLMLDDLKQALRDPEGDFVDNKDYVPDMPTQKISLKDIEEEAKRNEKRSKKKENKLIAFVKKHKVICSFIGVILLFVLSLGGTILYSRLTDPKEVLLPNIVGISEEEAKKELEEKGLNFEVASKEYNTQYAAGYIISQDPTYSENYNVKEGATVKAIISMGIEEATVPKVIGMTEKDAIKALEDAKLKYQIVEEESKKVEAGYVISQETDANSKVNAGDTVVIHISTGVKKSSVVSVVGKSEEEAKNALEALGLKVSVAYDEEQSKDNGVVLKQSIDAGKEVEQGSSVTITVNKLTETKSATLTVNVKSLLGGKVEYEEVQTTVKNNTDGTNTSVVPEKKVKDVKVKILVGSDTVYNDKLDPTTTNLVQSISGKGTVTVKVYIDDVLKSTKDINLNSTNSLTIE